MVELVDLGFAKNIIFETIVSTYNSDGTVNAAPMGIRMENRQTLILKIFNSSTTNRNLQTSKCGVINLTSDVEVFYKSTFKDANPDGKLPSNWFEKADTVNAPKLRYADATIEISIKIIEPTNPERTILFCTINKIAAAKKYPQVYCRALSATVEAITDATRVEAFIADATKKKNLQSLLKRIENHRDLVERVAPNSIYALTMADLMKKLESWRNKA